MSYEQFIEEVNTYSRIQAIQSQLSWDQSVMMPPNGAKARAETLAWLSGRAHETITSKKMGEFDEQILSDDDIEAALRQELQENDED